MKNAELKRVRKRLAAESAVLMVICILIILCGRFLAGKEFRMTYELYRDILPEKPEELKFDWENGEIRVEQIEIPDRSHFVMGIVPEKPGTYPFWIRDEDGQSLFYDELHVTKAGTVFSMQSGNFTGDTTVIFGITLLLLGTGVLCLVHFAKLRGSLLYTYDAILAFGGGVFCSITGLNLLNFFIRRVTHTDLFGMREVYQQLSLSGGTFMIITAPLIVLFSLLMIISNIELLRHERFRIQNILGIGTGLLLILLNAGGFWQLMADFTGSVQQVRIFYTINTVYCTGYAYFECILLGAVVCGIRAARHVPERNQDFIVILGCGFRKDGSLPPLIRGRVDKALEFWKRQKQENGIQAVLIPSGGQGPDEPMPEAEAMGRYLRSCGVPEEAILQEEKSRNTYQNMEFSEKLIREKTGSKEKHRAIFVTTNYHVFRSGVWANLAGFHAEGLGSRTKWWFWPNAFIRECIGLFANRIPQEIAWLVILVLLFGSISMMIV